MESVDELFDRLLAFSERILVFFSQFSKNSLIAELPGRNNPDLGALWSRHASHAITDS